MIQSHVVDVDGVFVGAAVRLHDGYRFVAVDLRLEDIDGSLWPTREAVQRVARQLLIHGRLGPAAVPSAAPQN